MTDDGCPSQLTPAAPAGLAVRDTAGKDDFGEVAAAERGLIAAVDPNAAAISLRSSSASMTMPRASAHPS